MTDENHLVPSHAHDSDRVREAIADIIAGDGNEPHLIGDLTLIAELTSPEGETHLFTLWSDGMTVWKERGMLMHRLDRLGAMAVVTELDEDD